MCFYPFLDLERLEAKVSLNEKEARIFNYLDLVDSLLDQLLAEELVLLINVDDKDVALFISSVQLLLLVVPAQASENGLVWIAKLVMSRSFSFGCFEPLQGLVVANCENEILLHDKQNLNDADPVDEVLLQLQSEEAVLFFSPSLKRLKDVHGTFGVARKDL